MIKIMKIECVDNTTYDYVECPACESRLCDKPINEKVSLLQIMSKNNNSKINHIIIKCQVCGSRFLVSTQ